MELNEMIDRIFINFVGLENRAIEIESNKRKIEIFDKLKDSLESKRKEIAAEPHKPIEPLFIYDYLGEVLQGIIQLADTTDAADYDILELYYKEGFSQALRMVKALNKDK